MTCQILDVVQLVHETVFEICSDLFDKFYEEPKLTIPDTSDMSAIEGLNDLDQEEVTPGDILFIGTSDYQSFFWQVQRPGHQTSENFLSMLILEPPLTGSELLTYILVRAAVLWVFVGVVTIFQRWNSGNTKIVKPIR